MSDFNGLRAPRVPESLRERTLRSAAAALESRPTVWEHLWESQPLRAGWVVATIGLIVANVVISFPRAITPEAGPVATSTRDRIEALGDVLALPAIEISPRAEGLLDEETPSRVESRDNEVQS
ncbi:MAG: hypothetical protein R3344_09750 [Acidobacteriota bacterium]|nr:hypothetical protein [Acidobacteriota bacterium]